MNHVACDCRALRHLTTNAWSQHACGAVPLLWSALCAVISHVQTRSNGLADGESTAGSCHEPTVERCKAAHLSRVNCALLARATMAGEVMHCSRPRHAPTRALPSGAGEGGDSEHRTDGGCAGAYADAVCRRIRCRYTTGHVRWCTSRPSTCVGAQRYSSGWTHSQVTIKRARG